MQVILIKDVDHLGGKDELVTVKNGYARNYLIPTKHAVEASPSNLKQLEERLKAKAKKEAELAAKKKKNLLKMKKIQCDPMSIYYTGQLQGPHLKSCAE
mgnify:CR=1 FL=1